MISAGLATVAEIHLPICSPPASEFASGMGFLECKQDLRKKTPEEKTLSVTSHLGPWSTRMLYKASGLRLEKPDLKDHIVLESISLCNYSVKNAYVSKIHYIYLSISIWGIGENVCSACSRSVRIFSFPHLPNLKRRLKSCSSRKADTNVVLQHREAVHLAGKRRQMSENKGVKEPHP